MATTSKPAAAVDPEVAIAHRFPEVAQQPRPSSSQPLPSASAVSHGSLSSPHLCLRPQVSFDYDERCGPVASTTCSTERLARAAAPPD